MIPVLIVFNRIEHGLMSLDTVIIDSINILYDELPVIGNTEHRQMLEL